MTEYALPDLLLFSPDVYWRMHARLEQSFFLINLVANGLLLLSLFIRRRRLLQFCLLAACWALVGWHYYLIEYQNINWFALYPGVIALLLTPGILAIGLAQQTEDSHPPSPLQLSVILYVSLLHPIIYWVSHQHWQLSGLASTPMPLFLLTFGLVLSVKFRFKSLLTAAIVGLIAMETLTLYVIDDLFWQEAPVFVLFCLMMAYYQPRLVARYPKLRSTE